MGGGLVSTVRFSDAVSALAAAFQSAAPLAGVTVADGPSPTAAADQDFIIVGHDGTLDPDGALSGVTQGGTLTQQWLDFPAVREETGLIHCVAVSQIGDGGDLPGRRARAQALMQACENAAAAAGIVSGLQFDGTQDAVVVYRQGGQGCAVVIAFTVAYSTGW